VILADTSAWIEYLQATGSRTHLRLKAQMADPKQLATTEVVVMEVLAGARNPHDYERLQRMLETFSFLPLQGLTDYEDAAALYRSCRSQGATIRKMVDCLVAVVAIRWRIPVLHCDRDYDALARCTPLRVDEP
jgi:predicted nucleic acid-binding protein